MELSASKKRLALAIYLDLVVFSAAWGVMIHFVAPGRQHTLLQYRMFAVLEAMLLAVVKWSPGEYFLSVFYSRRPYDPIEPEGTAPRGALVDPRVWSRETVLTVLLGVFLVVEGGKSFVRWTMWSPPQPFFGTRLSPGPGAALAMAEGLVYVTLGALVLRLRPLAPAAVVGLSVFQLANTIVSWRLWDEFAREMVLRRRNKALKRMRLGLRMEPRRLERISLGVLAAVLFSCAHVARRPAAGSPNEELIAKAVWWATRVPEPAAEYRVGVPSLVAAEPVLRKAAHYADLEVAGQRVKR